MTKSKFILQYTYLDLLDLVYKTMETGTIARLMEQGYGFISREGQEKDLFFHSNELEGVTFEDLQEGDKVTFEVAQGDKGPNAVQVSRVA